MELYQNAAGMRVPAPSVAERMPAISSRGHSSGHLILREGGRQRVLLVESDLEFKWATILAADPDVLKLKEQVRLDWEDNGRQRSHFFDFLATMRSGSRAAMIVKPEKRTRSEVFLSEVRAIAEFAVRVGFVDEVRVLTDACIDEIRLKNAKMIRSMREVDEEADAEASQIAADLIGANSIAELVDRIALGARGFRAVVRLIAYGHLECLHHEVFSPQTLVKGGRDK
ncbi:hypothetical protein [Phaeobacter inhibens]|uniref:hypothetical protein n=1 Tax=Phaeobacter inhibens TaxID=221822 RepID=UPI0021A54D21|nr:hypothetical protein [Phaeobacter inhibens]UWR49784.1 hypothetical protein K4F87_03270 [Phaeobacter inhibens]UWR61413.1 hypothetical protein K4F88_03480 [Phaeobacter inhibens]